MVHDRPRAAAGSWGGKGVCGVLWVWVRETKKHRKNDALPFRATDPQPRRPHGQTRRTYLVAPHSRSFSTGCTAAGLRRGLVLAAPSVHNESLRLSGGAKTLIQSGAPFVPKCRRSTSRLVKAPVFFLKPLDAHALGVDDKGPMLRLWWICAHGQTPTTGRRFGPFWLMGQKRTKCVWE